MQPKRIVLIHATPVSQEPIAKAFAECWPQADTVNILDDSLGADLNRQGSLGPAITARIGALADYGLSIGADGILFTCSAFGAAIDEVKQRLPIPVLTPNEAMLEEALGIGGKIGLLASFGPTVASMKQEFLTLAESLGKSVELVTTLQEEAFTALNAGDRERHNRLLTEAALKLRGCDCVALAQFSTALAARDIAARLNCPVLTTPHSAVNKIRRLVNSNA